jgi:hypothetical protein
VAIARSSKTGPVAVTSTSKNATPKPARLWRRRNHAHLRALRFESRLDKGNGVLAPTPLKIRIPRVGPYAHVRYVSRWFDATDLCVAGTAGKISIDESDRAVTAPWR